VACIASDKVIKAIARLMNNFMKAPGLGLGVVVDVGRRRRLLAPHCLRGSESTYTL
jgi:hypothetical protein